MPSKGRILVADDEPTFVLAVADLLRQQGYHVETAPDGLSAAAELNTGQYDLLIADIKMPGNPQLELIRHLPEMAEGVPAILVTANPTPETRAASADLPVLAYLVKPVNFERLLAEVGRCLAHGAVHRTSRAVCKRLDEWLHECHSVEQLIGRGTPGPGTTPEAFVTLTLRHVVGCLNDLNEMWRRVSESRPAPDGAAPDAAGVVKTARPDALGKALNGAIEVFESTAMAFYNSQRAGSL